MQDHQNADHGHLKATSQGKQFNTKSIDTLPFQQERMICSSMVLRLPCQQQRTTFATHCPLPGACAGAFGRETEQLLPTPSIASTRGAIDVWPKPWNLGARAAGKRRGFVAFCTLLTGHMHSFRLQGSRLGKQAFHAVTCLL